MLRRLYSKLPKRFRRAPREKDRVSLGRGTIEVYNVKLFSDLAADACVDFCHRVFECDHVCSLEIDSRACAATIHTHGTVISAETLEQLSDVLQAPVRPNRCQSLQILPEDPHGERIRFQRDGHTCSTVAPRGPVAQIPATKSGAGMAVGGIRRLTYLSLAAASFGLAGLGVVVPGLPTVPFLLVTSYFLVRSSPRLNERLLRSRTFGPMIRDWHEHRAMRPKVKAFSIGTMILVVVMTVFFGGLSLSLLIVVLLLVSLGLAIIVRIPTITDGAQTSVRGSIPASSLALSR